VRCGADLALLNAMLGVLDREDLVDRDFVARHTRGWEEAVAVAREWTPERAQEVCGVSAADIEAATRRFAAGRSLALWSMGANQSSAGTLKNRALINLCLAAGQLGKPGCGPFSLTGQPNAMGGRESGGAAQTLPGYRLVQSEADRAEMTRRWDLPDDGPGISPRPGLTAVDLFNGLEAGEVKAVWIVATLSSRCPRRRARVPRSSGPSSWWSRTPTTPPRRARSPMPSSPRPPGSRRTAR